MRFRAKKLVGRAPESRVFTLSASAFDGPRQARKSLLRRGSSTYVPTARSVGLGPQGEKNAPRAFTTEIDLQ
jgi:hypothetical protein